VKCLGLLNVQGAENALKSGFQAAVQPYITKRKKLELFDVPDVAGFCQVFED
jgi:hypothetical protein